MQCIEDARERAAAKVLRAPRPGALLRTMPWWFYAIIFFSVFGFVFTMVAFPGFVPRTPTGTSRFGTLVSSPFAFAGLLGFTLGAFTILVIVGAVEVPALVLRRRLRRVFVGKTPRSFEQLAAFEWARAGSERRRGPAINVRRWRESEWTFHESAATGEPASARMPVTVIAIGVDPPEPKADDATEPVEIGMSRQLPERERRRIVTALVATFVPLIIIGIALWFAVPRARQALWHVGYTLPGILIGPVLILYRLGWGPVDMASFTASPGLVEQSCMGVRVEFTPRDSVLVFEPQGVSAAMDPDEIHLKASPVRAHFCREDGVWRSTIFDCTDDVAYRGLLARWLYEQSDRPMNTDAEQR